MDVENPETNQTEPETVEEREKRTRKTVPIRLWVGSDAAGWKPVGPETFADERDAWRWVEKNGQDGASYQPVRAYGAKKVQPRKLVEADGE